MTNNVIISKYTPITLNMHIDIKSIFEKNIDIKLTNIMDYPKCSIGFHHFIHSLKKDTEILKQFENKKKVYLVTNEFEIDVDSYDNCISKEVDKFLNIKDKIPKIISLDFYKIWEILFMFNLINMDTDLKVLYLTDSGSSVQSLIHFREKYAKNTKNDFNYVLKTDKINEELFTYYNKSKNILYYDKISDKFDLIISGINYNYDNDNENIIEQEYFKTIFTNLLYIIKNQKKNGNCIIKIFETFTNVTSKIFAILISIYEQIFVVKPFISRSSESERFIICMGFKYTDKDNEYNNILKKIEEINKLINDNAKMTLCNIFKTYELTFKFKIRMIKLNTLLTNKLFKAIGENVNFINSQKYYGDKYQQYRDAQIEANNYWVETYLPELKNFKEIKKRIVENSHNSNKINMDDCIQLEKKMQSIN